MKSQEMPSSKLNKWSHFSSFESSPNRSRRTTFVERAQILLRGQRLRLHRQKGRVLWQLLI